MLGAYTWITSCWTNEETKTQEDEAWAAVEILVPQGMGLTAQESDSSYTSLLSHGKSLSFS